MIIPDPDPDQGKTFRIRNPALMTLNYLKVENFKLSLYAYQNKASNSRNTKKQNEHMFDLFLVCVMTFNDLYWLLKL